MIKKVEMILHKTGIPFEAFDEGIVEYRAHYRFRDRNFPKGEGYLIHVQVGETRGLVKIVFESFSKFLFDIVKKKLAENIDLISNYKVEGRFYLEGDNERRVLSSESIKAICKSDFSIIYESPMKDLRKEEEVERLAVNLGHVASLMTFTLLPYRSEDFGEVEGMPGEVTATKYERNRRNRSLCLHYYGYSCQVCAFNFEHVYGECAKDFIHVHHIEQLSEVGVVYIDPIKDLIPLCPNCHAVAHLTTPPLSPDVIRDMINKGV